MWPRTPEERARNRNTGFVCFMTRADAQEASKYMNENLVLDCNSKSSDFFTLNCLDSGCFPGC